MSKRMTESQIVVILKEAKAVRSSKFLHKKVPTSPFGFH
jgi:hypothetical protein